MKAGRGVAIGYEKEATGRPRDAYTRTLLASVPRLPPRSHAYRQLPTTCDDASRLDAGPPVGRDWREDTGPYQHLLTGTAALGIKDVKEGGRRTRKANRRSP